MKRLLAVLLVIVSTIVLIGCKGKSKPLEPLEESKFHDGTFTAFDEKTPTEGAEGGELTWVTVVVEDGKIASYYIDVLQLTGGVYNEKSKKELGDEYGMKDVGPGYKLVDGVWVVEGTSQKEWYEQAALIEAKWLADGVDSVTTLEDRIDNVAGATILGNTYITVALDVLEIAKGEKVQPELPTEITSRLD